MSESKAAESYDKFDTLRERFGGATKSLAADSKCNTAGSSRGGMQRKGRRDPRANAPPLVPLVEESDQLQEALVSSPTYHICVRKSILYIHSAHIYACGEHKRVHTTNAQYCFGSAGPDTIAVQPYIMHKICVCLMEFFLFVYIYTYIYIIQPSSSHSKGRWKHSGVIR